MECQVFSLSKDLLIGVPLSSFLHKLHLKFIIHYFQFGIFKKWSKIIKSPAKQPKGSANTSLSLLYSAVSQGQKLCLVIFFLVLTQCLTIIDIPQKLIG